MIVQSLVQCIVSLSTYISLTRGKQVPNHSNLIGFREMTAGGKMAMRIGKLIRLNISLLSFSYREHRILLFLRIIVLALALIHSQLNNIDLQMGRRLGCIYNPLDYQTQIPFSGFFCMMNELLQFTQLFLNLIYYCSTS